MVHECLLSSNPCSNHFQQPMQQPYQQPMQQPYQQPMHNTGMYVPVIIQQHMNLMVTIMPIMMNQGTPVVVQAGVQPANVRQACNKNLQKRVIECISKERKITQILDARRSLEDKGRRRKKNVRPNRMKTGTCPRYFRRVQTRSSSRRL